jgi:hypothetical protein
MLQYDYNYRLLDNSLIEVLMFTNLLDAPQTVFGASYK